MKAAVHQVQLIDHQRMEKSGKIGARRHAHAREGIFDGTGATHACPALEHQDALARACQVGSAREAVMTCTDDDGIPLTGSNLRDGLRQADLAQHRSGGRARVARWRGAHDLPRSRLRTRRLRFDGSPALNASNLGIALRSSATRSRNARLASVSRYSVCATAAGPRTSLRSSTSTSKSPPSVFTCNMSPARTGRALLAGCPCEITRPRSHAREASARVLKNPAAQSHLSIRTSVMPYSLLLGIA